MEAMHGMLDCIAQAGMKRACFHFRRLHNNTNLAWDGESVLLFVSCSLFYFQKYSLYRRTYYYACAHEPTSPTFAATHGTSRNHRMMAHL